MNARQTTVDRINEAIKIKTWTEILDKAEIYSPEIKPDIWNNLIIAYEEIILDTVQPLYFTDSQIQECLKCETIEVMIGLMGKIAESWEK